MQPVADASDTSPRTDLTAPTGVEKKKLDARKQVKAVQDQVKAVQDHALPEALLSASLDAAQAPSIPRRPEDTPCRSGMEPEITHPLAYAAADVSTHLRA
ncbi:MAG: hypothetical protein QOG99_2928 [Frankiales bacterium]|nr:hypothetical protein [Frankiales bacterium]